MKAIGRFWRADGGMAGRDFAFAAALVAVLGVAAASKLSQASENGSLAGAMAFLGAKTAPDVHRFDNVDAMPTGAIRLNPCKLDPPAAIRLPSAE